MNKIKYTYLTLILLALAYFIGINITTISITDPITLQLQAVLIGGGIITFLIGFVFATYFAFKPSKK